MSNSNNLPNHLYGPRPTNSKRGHSAVHHPFAPKRRPTPKKPNNNGSNSNNNNNTVVTSARRSKPGTGTTPATLANRAKNAGQVIRRAGNAAGPVVRSAKEGVGAMVVHSARGTLNAARGTRNVTRSAAKWFTNVNFKFRPNRRQARCPKLYRWGMFMHGLAVTAAVFKRALAVKAVIIAAGLMGNKRMNSAIANRTNPIGAVAISANSILRLTNAIPEILAATAELISAAPPAVGLVLNETHQGSRELLKVMWNTNRWDMCPISGGSIVVFPNSNATRAVTPVESFAAFAAVRFDRGTQFAGKRLNMVGKYAARKFNGATNFGGKALTVFGREVKVSKNAVEAFAGNALRAFGHELKSNKNAGFTYLGKAIATTAKVAHLDIRSTAEFAANVSISIGKELKLSKDQLSNFVDRAVNETAREIVKTKNAVGEFVETASFAAGSAGVALVKNVGHKLNVTAVSFEAALIAVVNGTATRGDIVGENVHVMVNNIGATMVVGAKTIWSGICAVTVFAIFSLVLIHNGFLPMTAAAFMKKMKDWDIDTLDKQLGVAMRVLKGMGTVPLAGLIGILPPNVGTAVMLALNRPKARVLKNVKGF